MFAKVFTVKDRALRSKFLNFTHEFSDGRIDFLNFWCHENTFAVPVVGNVGVIQSDVALVIVNY